MANVNLDSLLPREDFDSDENQNSTKKKESFSISDLRDNDFFYLTLRKPDFQRETNEWTPAKICDMVKSFVHGELIPAVILWKSKSGHNFVIDGSHRVSSLVAWINDDYGDGIITKEKYDGLVPDEQIAIATRARKLIEKEIGKYSDYKLALTKPENVKPDLAKRARDLGSIAVQLQWVEGDAKVAEASFFKINQQASKIDPTEFRLIKSREKANGIAARAIIKSGKGHQYWSKFEEDKRLEIEKLSKEINEMFFLPKLSNPVKTLDLPIGGKGYSSQSPLLIFEYVNLVNSIKDTDDTDKSLIDEDGIKTIQILKACKKVAARINSSHPSSLGLHPAVYFYSKGGRHKTASFFAVTLLIIELEKTNKFKDFIKIRKDFEELLLEYDYIIQQILRYYRGSSKAVPHIKDFYLKIIEELKRSEKEKVITNIIKLKEYDFIKIDDRKEEEYGESEDFSRGAKSAVFIAAAIKNAVRCKICNSMIHINSMTIDHIERKEDGGIGTSENGQLAHPYCNSTIKN